MPARTVSSASTARGTNSIPAAPRGNKRSVPASTAERAKVAPGRGPSARPCSTLGSKSEIILSALKTPSKCSIATVELLLGVLETTAAELGITLATSASRSATLAGRAEGSTLRPGKASSTLVRTRRETSKKSTAPADALEGPSLSVNKRIHLAKQAVNAVIAALNDLVALGWKAESESTASGNGTTMRSGSAAGSSTSSSTAPSFAQNEGSVTEHNVTALFDCSRVAARYLGETSKDEFAAGVKALELEFAAGVKALELESIMCSIARKMAALEMHSAAATEITWLQKTVLATYSPDEGQVSYAYALPTTAVSPKLVELILDLQALAVHCVLFTTPLGDVEGLLTSLTQHPQGPLSWQQYARSLAGDEKSQESIDRQAYSIERGMNRYLSKHIKRPGWKDHDLTMQCRKTCLDFLLFVSDLDIDAFWDRTARVGSSYYRSKGASEGAPAKDKKTAFCAVDEMFRDVIRRAEQMDRGRREYLRGNAFTNFCEVWIQLARRAGEAQAIHHVAGLLGREGDFGQYGEAAKLSKEQVHSLLLQISAQLAPSVIDLDELQAGRATPVSKGAQLRAAVVQVDSVARFFVVAGEEALRRVFRTLDQLLRRCLRLVDEQQCDIDPLLLAICRTYRQYLESDGQAAADDDGAVLEDYIYTLRSLANATFLLSDRRTHEAAAAHLASCGSILRARQGRMAAIDESVRSEKVRLLSTSWYYIGGQLYNDKKPELAVRFLAAACESAQESIAMCDTVEAEGGKVVKRPEGTAKKWEHLAVAYRSICQPRQSYEAYLSGFLSIERALWEEVADRAARMPICDVFVAEEVGSKALADVAAMAKAAFEVSAFDMLVYEKGGEEDLGRRLLDAGVPQECVGALLEQCLLSLDNTMHREEGPQAALCLLDRLLDLYPAQTSPVRRMRVLVRRVELAVMQPQLQQEQVNTNLHEVEQLNAQISLSQDTQLSRFVPQYRAMLQLLLLVLARQGVPSGAQNKAAQYASQATHWLKEILQAPPIQPTLPRATAQKQSLRTTSAPPQAPLKGLPVTPPRRSRLLAADKGRGKANSHVQSLYDDAPRLCSQMELAVEVLCTSGHSLASLELLKVARKLSESLADPCPLLRFSAALATQYVLLGDAAKAGKMVEQITEKMGVDGVTPDTQARCFFASAAYFCYTGHQDKSIGSYTAGMQAAARTDAETRVNSLQSGVNRCLISERQAMASSTLAAINLARGNSVGALKAAIASVRSAIKAGMQLSRLTTMSDLLVEKQDAHSNSPFVTKGIHTDLAASVEPRPPPRLSSWSVAILHWRLTRVLLLAHLRVAQLYRLQGSARDAEAFLSEAVDFGSSVHAPFALARALIERGSIRMQMNLWDKGEVDLVQAMEALGQEPSRSMEMVEMHLVHAQRQVKTSSWQAALHCYEQADDALASLADHFEELDAAMPPSKVGKVLSGTRMGILLPEVRCKLLQQQAWVLHMMNRVQESVEVMDRAASLVTRGAGKEENSIFQGRIAVHQSSRILKADQVMAMLSESAISLPMVRETSGKRPTSGATIKSALAHLVLAQTLFENVVRGKGRLCLDTINLRTACVNLAVSHTVSSTLTGTGRAKVEEVVAMLDQSSSLTLQREMLDAVDTKLDVRPNEADKDDEATSLSDYWTGVRQRHQEPGGTGDAPLPPNWTVVSITLHRERNCLLLTRRSGGPPLVFSLPIDRHSRREGEEEADMGVDAVLEELKRIVDESNVATHAAQHLEGMDARKQWWSARRALDVRMKELLSAVEATWLGAFKSVLLPRPDAPEEAFAVLRSSIDALFQRALFSSSSSGRRTSRVGLDDGVFECFSALSSTACSDEELEDLIHFVMDAYQLHGMPVAVDEVDLDQCVTELRSALDSFRAKQQQRPPNEDRHLFLILDKDTCAIPWESIPLLRNEAVCRIPSTAFLQDRLLLSGVRDGLTIAPDSARVWYLLNPSKDLTRTQDRFLPWLEGRRGNGGGWTGISGRAPVMDEMADALQNSDLVLYFGHGGGEQYLRPSRLRGLKQCAVTMLWGCSSGVLKELGDFDRSGTPYNYLMAGCPSLLANLWDATDKELDGVSDSVLSKMGLKGEAPAKRLSIAQAVAQSRDACKLPYLTGAATVVYGIPVYYQ